MDKSELYQAIDNFRFSSKPSNSSSSAPATVADINRLIDQVSKLMTFIVDSIDD